MTEIDREVLEHPRRINWVGAAALSIGATASRAIFLFGILLGLFGPAAVPFMVVGLALAGLAAPGWLELSGMYPNRVGGIAAACSEAFRPYGAVLANLTGVSYWWGWIPTCGLSALFSAQAIEEWFLGGSLPWLTTTTLATVLVLLFAAINLAGLRWAVALALPIAAVAFVLAFAAAAIPVAAGHVDWHQAFDFHLTTPFAGAFGKVTAVMAGIYLVGFAAPSFESAACNVGELREPRADQARALWVSGAAAALFFVVLPLVWLGVFGDHALAVAHTGRSLAELLGPTFAPLVGALAKAFACAFVAFASLGGTLQPLTGSSRTLSQLAEDGLLPRSLAYRHPKTDAPMVAIAVTAGAALLFMWAGDPISLLEAANLTYLIAIAAPSVAVWLLRRPAPRQARAYRASDRQLRLGLFSAMVWLAATILGFETYRLPVVLLGILLAFSGSLLYAWRLHRDRRAAGMRSPRRSIHLKLTGAMLAVLALDGVGYLVAVDHVPQVDAALIALLKDIFVTVGLLTILVGLILPGMVAHTVDQVTVAARRLAEGTLNELTRAMEAMASGDLEHATATVTTVPVQVRSQDEFGLMAGSFNVMQAEAARAAIALDAATAQLRANRAALERTVAQQTAELSATSLGLERAKDQRRQLLERLRTLSTRLSVRQDDHFDLAAVLQEVVVTLGETMELDSVFVQLAKPDGGLDYVATVWRRAANHAPVRQEALPQAVLAILGQVAARRSSLVLRDIKSLSDRLINPEVRQFVEVARIGGVLLCPFYTADGELLGVLGLVTIDRPHHFVEDDVTVAETVAADLARAVVSSRLFEHQEQLVRQLQELDRTKGEMLSTFSHELRTPLASIRAYVELLRESGEDDPAEADRMLEVIERNAARLSALIEDILTLSHLDSEVFDIVLVPIELDPLIESVTEALRPSAEAKLLSLDDHLRSGGVEVLGDATQLERLLFNLISNAIKFTPAAGEVHVTTAAQDQSVVLVVADTGIGIPDDEQEQVFSRFYRSSLATQKVIPGTGLGLSIAEAIVEHHGGTIALQSSVGVGTSVTVTLPRATRATTPRARATINGATVLREGT